jgi:hypothetical protein
MNRLETIVRAWATMTDAPVCIAYYEGTDKPWTARIASGLDAPVLETVRATTFDELISILADHTIFALGVRVGDLYKQGQNAREAEEAARAFVDKL